MNSYFNTISFKNKLYLYLIPPLLIGFLYLEKESILCPIFEPSSKKELLLQETQKSDNISRHTTKVEVASAYKKLATTLSLEVVALHFVDPHIELHLSGTFSNLLLFLKNVEHYNPIEQFHFQTKNNTTLLIATLAYTKFTPATQPPQLTPITLNDSLYTISLGKTQERNTIDPLAQNQTPTSTIQKQISENRPKAKKEVPQVITKNEGKPPEPILHTIEESPDDELVELFPPTKTLAIVGKYVLLGKEWLTVGDQYKGYTIVSITETLVTFEKDGKTAIKEMF